MDNAGVAPGPIFTTLLPNELMQRFGGLPLLHQPGEKWLYHSGSDILGVLLARVSGQTLETFLRERIFAPLGMKDTGFSVPAAKHDRLATCYWTDPKTGKLAVFDEARGGRYGEYRDVVPNERLAFTWRWVSRPERESVVTITLRLIAEGTELTLTHEQFFDDAERDSHRDGWNGALDKLETYVQ